MNYWRIFLNFIVGFSLFLVLHGCQIGQFDSSDITASVGTSNSQTPLPPETALVENVDTDKIYNPSRGDVRLVVISDLNGAYGATDYDPEVDKAITLLPFWQPDLVLCSGDMVAGQKPTLTKEQLNAMWLAFDEHIGNPLRQSDIPYGFTMGNHDASAAKNSSGGFLFERERNVASDYWNDPKRDPGLEFVNRYEFPFYYTFKFDDIFFLVWDGSSAKIPQDKLNWVEQALESPEAQSAKLKIVLGHLPLYGIAEGRDLPGEVMDNAEQLREMLQRHQVHTYISGHQHAYYPGYKGELQLLHAGILGSGPRQFIDSQLPPRKTLTVIDINYGDRAALANPDRDLTTYTTYDMETLELIEYEELPRFLTGHNGMVLRRDLAPEDLTSSERATCESRLNEELCRI